MYYKNNISILKNNKYNIYMSNEKDIPSYGQFCIDNPNASKEQRQKAIRNFINFTNSNTWSFFNPDYSKPVRINIFDDGNDIYKSNENKWFVCGEWRGKIKLINIDGNTTINSISEWKTQSI